MINFFYFRHFQQVASILKSARPKIQKWINDAETDDSVSLDTFLQINDHINTVVSRYEAFKKGDFSFAANPIPSELSNNSVNQHSSLIDFDDAQTTASSGNASGGGINDLAGLFASPSPPSISQQQAFGASGFQTHSPIPSSGYNPNNGFGGLRLGGGNGTSSLQQQPRQSATPPGAITLPITPGPGQASVSVQPSQPQQLRQPQQQPQPQQQSKDPFADLAGLY